MFFFLCDFYFQLFQSSGVFEEFGSLEGDFIGFELFGYFLILFFVEVLHLGGVGGQADGVFLDSEDCGFSSFEFFVFYFFQFFCQDFFIFILCADRAGGFLAFVGYNANDFSACGLRGFS